MKRLQLDLDGHMSEEIRKYFTNLDRDVIAGKINPGAANLHGLKLIAQQLEDIRDLLHKVVDREEENESPGEPQ